MRLYYFKSPHGNFGDDLNPWLWPKLLPQLLDGACFHAPEHQEANETEDCLFIGIGTLLNTTVPRHPKKLVFGSGAGYGPAPAVDARWHFGCVRGPLTAQALGLRPELAVTDSAFLLRRVELPAPAAPARFSFMPHIQSEATPLWKSVCNELGIRFIHPADPVESVLSRIRSSEILICEAMHAAIVSDALRVPWIPVRCYRHINEFKWNDWCCSVGLHYQPLSLTSLWSHSAGTGLWKRAEASMKHLKLRAELKRLIRHTQPTLSADAVATSLTARLEESLQDLVARQAVAL